MFCNATLHPAYGRTFFLNRNTKDAAEKENLMGISIAMINKLWAEVEQRLEKSPWLAGNDITMADILMTVIANWIGYLPETEMVKI